jgi:hypothetical protein
MSPLKSKKSYTSVLSRGAVPEAGAGPGPDGSVDAGDAVPVEAGQADAAVTGEESAPWLEKAVGSSRDGCRTLCSRCTVSAGSHGPCNAMAYAMVRHRKADGRPWHMPWFVIVRPMAGHGTCDGW